MVLGLGSVRIKRVGVGGRHFITVKWQIGGFEVSAGG
jgi:hypothetical protein